MVAALNDQFADVINRTVAQPFDHIKGLALHVPGKILDIVINCVELACEYRGSCRGRTRSLPG